MKDGKVESQRSPLFCVYTYNYLVYPGTEWECYVLYQAASHNRRFAP